MARKPRSETSDEQALSDTPNVPTPGTNYVPPRAEGSGTVAVPDFAPTRDKRHVMNPDKDNAGRITNPLPQAEVPSIYLSGQKLSSDENQNAPWAVVNDPYGSPPMNYNVETGELERPKLDAEQPSGDGAVE